MKNHKMAAIMAAEMRFFLKTVNIYVVGVLYVVVNW